MPTNTECPECGALLVSDKDGDTHCPFCDAETAIKEEISRQHISARSTCPTCGNKFRTTIGGKKKVFYCPYCDVAVVPRKKKTTPSKRQRRKTRPRPTSDDSPHEPFGASGVLASGSLILSTAAVFAAFTFRFAELSIPLAGSAFTAGWIAAIVSQSEKNRVTGLCIAAAIVSTILGALATIAISR